MTVYDIVVFGATGFTGQFVAEETAKLCQNKQTTWAVAGRNKEKLRKCLETASQILNLPDVINTPIITADVGNESSISKMCSQARVIINCVGPYNKWGEIVVKNCVQSGTHHVDVSGEPIYLEKMQVDYHDYARSQGCYIVGACGFDSIPCDLGVQFVKRKFEGHINEIEAYVIANITEESYPIHSGTWASLVGGISDASSMRPIRRKIFAETVPKSSYRQVSRGTLFFSNVINKWCIPFLGSDKSVVNRSEHYLTKTGSQKVETQFLPYIGFRSWMMTVMVITFFGYLKLMTLTSFTRNLLLKHPEFFSFGAFSNAGATREQLANKAFSVTFRATGWDKEIVPKKSEKSINAPIPPNVTKTYKLVGPECGYIACSQMAVRAAYTILTEKDKMPETGGVFPPGAAFANTNFFDGCEHISIEEVNS